MAVAAVAVHGVGRQIWIVYRVERTLRHGNGTCVPVKGNPPCNTASLPSSTACVLCRIRSRSYNGHYEHISKGIAHSALCKIWSMATQGLRIGTCML